MNKYIYYKVCAVDKNYNQSEFSQVLQVERFHNFRLQAPVISDLKTKDDKVTLSWRKSSHPLASGYHVYSRLEDSKKWELIKTIKDVSTKTCNFKLANGSYSLSLKTYSDFAKDSPFALGIFTEIDKSKKSKIENFKGDHVDEYIKLTWDPIYNQPSAYILYKSMDSKPLVQIARVANNESYYMDKNLTQAGVYKYMIRYIDKKGRKSPFSEVTIKSKKQN